MFYRNLLVIFVTGWLAARAIGNPLRDAAGVDERAAKSKSYAGYLFAYVRPHARVLHEYE